MEEQENNANEARNGGEEDMAMRRNQVLMFGVVMLGILAICLAVSMPSDLEFDNTSIPSEDPMTSEQDESVIPSIIMTNVTNSTIKSLFKNPEDSVENRILRNIAIQKAIKGLHTGNSDDLRNMKLGDDITISEYGSGSGSGDLDLDNSGSQSDETKTQDRIDQIVQSFMETEEFENFIIDIEIHDAIERLRKEKGYKKRENTIFDDIFKQIERHFLGDDPEEVQLIRSVGEEMEKRAREIISMRKNGNLKNENNEEELIANELYEDYESENEDIRNNENENYENDQ